MELDIVKNRSRRRENTPNTKQSMPPSSRKRSFRWSFLFLGLGLLGVLYEFSPYISYYLLPQRSHEPIIIQSDGESISSSDSSHTTVEGNHLVIPKIGVNIPISEGPDERALEEGAWRYPGTAVPGGQGNTVITAHRFKFLPPHNKTFYLLDKLESGDTVIAYWEGQQFEYTVEKSFEVTADDVSVLARGEGEKMSLITCTPLFTQEKRLVVEAVLKKSPIEGEISRNN